MKNKDTNNLTRVAMLLLVALFSLTGARAQQTLPYSYGFEDNDLSVDGWTTSYQGSANASEFGIIAAAAQNGDYGFRFSSYSRDNVTYDQYLISPELNAETGVEVQFFYKASSSYGTETFKVGYSTTDTNPSSFTFGDEISTNSTSWAKYEEVFPAGTKYVAVFYFSNYQYRLYVDDFSFTGVFAAPRNLTASHITATSANISWTGNADSYNIRYSTFTGGDFFDDFENGLDAQGWTTIRNADGTEGTDWRTFNPAEFDNESVTSHSGDNVAMSRSWASSAYSVDNWLISPRLPLGGIMTYWVMDDGTYHEHYDIYVSTTTTDISAFTKVYEPGDASDSWTQVSVDFSSFVGQEGYVAFRLTDEDQDFLFIDDVTIFAPNWTTVNGVTSPYALEGLTLETQYVVQVQAVYADGESNWTSPVTFTTTSPNDAPTELAATDVKATSATLDWAGSQESYKLRYRQTSFFENFENVTGNNLPEGWTSIDNDGDDNNWYSASMGALSGSNCATSASYQGGALTPDNWLVTPKVALDGTMSVWLRAQDPDWAAEHFAIYLSTTGTDVSNFTTTLVPETEATGEYVEYTADLSAYAGQEGYIAIRHFNVTDMFRLNVDDFFIGNNSWTTINGVTNPYTIEGLAPETSYQVQVQGILSDGITEWSELSSFTTDVMPVIVELADNADNTSDINAFNGQTVNVQLTGRTLYKDDSWNTICLPFDVTIAGSPLDGATVMELNTDNSSLTESTLTLKFDEVSAIEAGKPYLIKWASGTNLTEEDLVFNDVEIKKDLVPAVVGSNVITFSGNYAPVPFEAGDKSILYVGANNQLYYPNAEVTMNAFRAYFQVDDSSLIKHFALKFSGDDATAIETIANGQQTTEGAIYNVAGQRLNKAQKGVNIVNGKKILK